MLNVIYLRHTVLIYIVHSCGLIVRKQLKLKVVYNNSLRRFMGLPWHNSASEMFVNLNIKSFGKMLRCFVYSFCSRIMTSGNLMLIGIYHAFALLILIYGLGGEHYYMLTCDWPHSYII